jgi:hypothetical protein
VSGGAAAAAGDKRLAGGASLTENLTQQLLSHAPTGYRSLAWSLKYVTLLPGKLVWAKDEKGTGLKVMSLDPHTKVSITGDILRIVCYQRTVMLRMPEKARAISADQIDIDTIREGTLAEWASDIEAEAMCTEDPNVDAEGARQLGQLCEALEQALGPELAYCQAFGSCFGGGPTGERRALRVALDAVATSVIDVRARALLDSLVTVGPVAISVLHALGGFQTKLEALLGRHLGRPQREAEAAASGGGGGGSDSSKSKAGQHKGRGVVGGAVHKAYKMVTGQKKGGSGGGEESSLKSSLNVSPLDAWKTQAHRSSVFGWPALRQVSARVLLGLCDKLSLLLELEMPRHLAQEIWAPIAPTEPITSSIVDFVRHLAEL